MNKLKLLLAGIASLFFVSMSAATVGAAPLSTVAAVDSKDAICEGVGTVSGSGNCNAGSGPSLNGIVKLVINVITLIAGIIAVIMIIVGGLKYITSSGDASSVSSAKNTIVYAVVGLIFVALAQFIVRFVIDKTD